MIEITLEQSSFQATRASFLTARTRVSKLMKEATETMAKDVILNLQDHAHKNDLGLEPLASSTIARKKYTAPAYADIPWIESHSFLDNLNYWWEGYGTKGLTKELVIGVPDGATKRSSDGSRNIDINEYIEVNEIRRPIFAMTLEEYEESGEMERTLDLFFGKVFD